MSSYLPAFLNAAILSVPLCAAIGLALRFTPRRVLNAATRHHVLWALLALVVVLPAAWFPRPAEHREQAVGPQRAGTSVSSDAGTIPEPDNFPAVRTYAMPAGRPLFPIALPSIQWTSAILILLAVTSLALLLRLGWSWIALERYKAHALPASADLEHAAKQWLAHCGSSRKISLRITEIGLAGPMAAGPWRPSILLPSVLVKEVCSEEMDRIGLHEAAHLARFDDYALAVQRVLEAIFFFHPAVRWIARQIDLEREIACDDCVVQITGAPRLYADSLARVAEFSAGMRHANTSAAAGYEGSHLATRVEMLLARGRHTSARLLRIPLIAGVVTIFLLAGTASESPLLFTFMTPAKVLAQAPAAASPSVPKPASVPAAFSPAAPAPAALKHEANVKPLTPKEESFNAEIAHNPRFTTVSITPVQWKYGAVSTNASPGRIDYKTIAIKRLFFLAWPELAYYRFVWPDGAIPPGGAWYDISVTMPEDTTPEQLQRMTQALLADYFKVSVHWETRDVDIYAVRVADGGIKFHKSADPSNPAFKGSGGKEGWHIVPAFPEHRFPGSGMTLSQFTQDGSAPVYLDRPLVDMTGLEGVYDIDLFIARDTSAAWPLHPLTPGATPVQRAANDGFRYNVFFQALQDQLGLRADAETDPTKMLIIDSLNLSPAPQ
jgi:uncharacterized protein (TIGR03435 family)